METGRTGIIILYMAYSEKLKDPRWQKKRLEILQRDEFKCQWCGDTKTTLHVHHDIYEGEDPWDTDELYLTTLCEDCHSIEHFKYTELEKILLSAVRNFRRFDLDYIKLLNRVVKSHVNLK